MGILALMLGLFLGDHFFLPPKAVPGTDHSLVMFRLARYVFTALLGIVLIEVQHRQRRRTLMAVHELRREVARRMRSEADVVDAQGQLARHAEELEQQVAERTATLAASVDYVRGLLYHIAHNLRAPLRAMGGYASFLMDEYAAKMDETARGYSLHICEAAQRMDGLIGDLLAYGRLGHMDVALARVSLREVLERALYQLAYEFQARKAEVQVVDPLSDVRANAELLEQVLTNLLENAVKFVPHGVAPRVRVRAEERGSSVRIWIEDNGVGVEPQHHERIFGVFQTLHAVRGHDGAGIGLAIVRQATQRMGGRAAVESQLGSGSRFWVDLPRAQVTV